MPHRRGLRRLLPCLLASMLLPVVVVAGEAEPAHACSCLSRTEAEAFADADAVFTGRVIGDKASRPATSPPASAAVVWTFRARDVYKGKVFRTQRVVSAANSAACGVAFPEHTTMLVFANARSDRRTLEVNACGATRLLSEGALDPALGTPSPPKRGSSARR